MNKYVALGLAVAAGIGGFLLATRRAPVVLTPPARIIHDTVARLDTVVLRKYVAAAVKPDTVWLTRETVTPPETVTVVPALIGLEGIRQPQEPGDTGVAYGFRVRPLLDGHYTLNNWRGTWESPGPLASIALDSDGIKLRFWPPALPLCALVCRVKQGAVAVAIFEGLRLILRGKP